MASTGSTNSNAAVNRLRDDWVRRLEELVNTVAAWANELGWSTRKIEKRMEDPQIGAYRAPALLLQQDTVRLILEPIARTAPGADGVVDLYLMPAYDDIASLLLVNGHWQLHYTFADRTAAPTSRNAKGKKLSRKSLAEVLEVMKQDAV